MYTKKEQKVQKEKIKENIKLEKLEESKEIRFHSTFCFTLIFKFLRQKDRFKYRLVNRDFNNFVLCSIEYAYFRPATLLIRQYKLLLNKFVNLKIIEFPKIYKNPSTKTVVGNQQNNQIQQITNFKLTKYQQLREILAFYPKLRSIELNLDIQPEESFNNLQTNITEFIIKKQTNCDLQILKHLQRQITSLKITIQSQQNQILNTLLNFQQSLQLCKLYVSIQNFDLTQIAVLQQFINQQQKLQVLYLQIGGNGNINVNLQIKQKLNVLILQDIKSIKSIQFSNVEKVIIESKYLTHTAIKYLFNKIDLYNELDITGICGAWFEFLDMKNYVFPIQKGINKKTIKLQIDQNQYMKFKAMADVNNIRLLNLNSIENLMNYY